MVNVRNSKSKKIFIAIILLLLFQGFSIKFITINNWSIINDIIIVIIAFSVFPSINAILQKRLLFFREILYLMLLPLVSIISSNIFHGQGFYESFLAYRPFLLYFFFFYLIRSKMSSEDLVEILLFFGVIVSLIYIVQSITFPNIIFQQNSVAISLGNAILEERAGLTRFSIIDPLYMVFALCYYSGELSKEITRGKIILFTICLTGIIFTLTRQIIIGSLISSLFIFVLSNKDKSKSISKLIVILAILIPSFLYFGAESIFSSLVNLTKEQSFDSSNYIRFQEVRFFLFDYMPSWFCYFFGNGLQYGASTYGKEISMYENSGMFRADIGLVGALNLFGIFYVITILSIYNKVFFKIKNIKPTYKFFFLYLFITSFTGDDYFSRPYAFIFILVLLYIIELNVTRKNGI